MTSTLFRNKFFVAAAILLAAAILITATAGIVGTFPAKAAEVQETRNTINVTGSGKISVSPDIAYVSLGVVTEDKDAKVAQQNNATAMDKIITKIKGTGIAAEDIKTTEFSIYPKYDYNKETGESKIIGYTVNNTVRVTVKDLKKTGSIIDIASENGANISNNISFGLSDYEKYYNEALKKAVAAAKKRAETMAGVLSIKLKKPVTVTESGGSAPVYNTKSYDMISGAAQASTPVEAGSIDVTANVSIVYEY